MRDGPEHLLDIGRAQLQLARVDEVNDQAEAQRRHALQLYARLASLLHARACEHGVEVVTGGDHYALVHVEALLVGSDAHIADGGRRMPLPVELLEQIVPKARRLLHHHRRH